MKQGGQNQNSRERRSKFAWRRLASKNQFFRLLQQDVRFRYTMAAFLIAGVFIALCVPRVWIVSPRGYPVVVRVRLIDLFEMPFVRKKAEAASRNGDYVAALHLWDRALLNNPCDLAANRGYFRDVALQQPPTRHYLDDSGARKGMYLAITATNADDLAAVAEVYLAYGLPDRAVSLLSTAQPHFSPRSAAVFGVAQMEARQVENFAEFWSRNSELLAASTDGNLCRLAWQSGWGHGEEQAKARAALELAAKDPKTSVMALRLFLCADENAVDLVAYRVHLKQLQEKGRERVRDVCAYWRLLMLCGKQQVGAELAGAYTSLPVAGSEARELVGAWRRLKLFERIDNYARGRMQLLRDDLDLWTAAGGALAEAGLWDGVRSLAAEIRQYYELKSHLEGYASYLDGMAAHFQHQRPHALEYLQAAVENLPENRQLAFFMARGMRQAGYEEQATATLAAVAGGPGKVASMLNSLYQSAITDKNDELMVGVAEELLRLNPSDRKGQERLAEALVKARQRPEEALQMLAGSGRSGPEGNLIYAAALAQTGKNAEAGEILNSLDDKALSEGDRALLGLVRAELHSDSGRDEEALKTILALDVRHFTSAQKEWVSKQKYLLRMKTLSSS